jgi:hypothetical protein
VISLLWSTELAMDSPTDLPAHQTARWPSILTIIAGTTAVAKHCSTGNPRTHRSALPMTSMSSSIFRR